MDSSTRQLFQRSSDYSLWAKKIQHATTLTQIDEVTRENYVWSLCFLRDELKEHYLKNHSWGNFLVQKISNTAVWQIEELIRFTKTLFILKQSDSNYNKLLRKFDSSKKTNEEAIHFVESASNFIQVGLKVRFVEESLVSTPDIEIIDANGERLYVEVTRVNDSKYREDALSNYQVFNNEFNFTVPRLSFAAKQKNIVPFFAYENYLQIIREAKKNAIDKQSIIEFSDSNLYFCVAFSEKQLEQKLVFAQIALKKNSFLGLNFDYNETNRILSKISRKKARQIPQNSNGLIFFSVHAFSVRMCDKKAMAKRFRVYLSRYPDIYGIVLYSSFADVTGKPQSEYNDEYWYVRKVYNGILNKEIFLIKNPRCILKVGEGLIKKILLSFQ